MNKVANCSVIEIKAYLQNILNQFHNKYLKEN